MPTQQINEISKVFQHGETLESSELNAIISQINSTIRKLNSVETSLNNHEYDVSIPITNIYCRTKKGINAINFFPQADAKRDELLEEVSNCLTTQGIKYNTNFSTVTLSENADLMNGVWTAYPQGVNESLPHEWEVSYKKLPDNSIMYMFGPVLRSNYGYSGADGDGVQYVYRVFNHELSDIERTNNTPIRPENPNANGEFIPSGWTDDPQGPTAEYPYEYVATLKRTNGSWGNFEKISLWSTYTEDGANGDFQARAFCRFIPITNKLAPNTPIGGTYENPQPGSNDNIQWSLTIPSGSEPLWTSTRIFKGTGQATEWGTPAIEADSAELDIEYSSNQEKPALNTLRTIPKTPHPSNNVWHDPSEANIDLSAMVWRAERKIKNGQYNGEWVITKIVGQKGSFKSMVFRRFKPTMQQSTPPIPTGGNYNNPIPDGGLWFDGIPSGDSKTNGPVWASTRIFYDDGTQSNWSTPQLQADSEDLDIEFSPATTQPSNPTGEPFSNREASGWYDPSSANFNSVGPMIWRAERKVNNGQYVGEWTVSRILGEKGEQGYRGDFVSRVFCRNSQNIGNDQNRPTGGTYDEPWPTNEDLSGNKIWSDGIPASGSGKIWTSTRKFYGDPNHEADEWSIPTIEADSNSLDIEYSTSVIEPSANTLRQTPGTSHPVNTGVNWYDPSQLDQIPTDPTTNKPYPIIWRAERRISGTVYDGDWVITRILGEEGPEGRRGSFKSCVFKRSNSVLSDFNVTVDGTGDGATYDSPIPNGSGVFAGWSDGIPAGDEILWMAVSKFTGNGNEHSNWTVTQQTDSVDLDIEFSPGEGTAHTCPAMSNSVFDTPIANYETNGNPPAKTSARIARENAGWYDASALPSGQTIVWRAERKVHNQQYEGDWVITRITGEKGDPATLTETQQQDLDSAGLQIVVTPQNIILDQSDALTGATDDKIDDVTASIVVYDRTGTALANNQYQIKTTDGVTLYAINGQIVNGVLQPLTPLTDYVEVSGANLTDAKSVKIKNLPITTTTENGNSTYTYTYNKGYIRVILTVPVGTSTKDVKIDIPWYLNKLGERETKIRGDVASTYMSRTVFSDPTDPTISAFTASILDGADGRLAEYGLIKTKQGGGYEASFDAQYLQNAAENVSKLSKSINGTNLLPDNWTTFSSPVEITTGSGVTTEKRATKASPQIPLSEGIYILSWYSTETSPNNFKVSVGTSASKISGSIPYITNNDITWQYCGIGDLSGGRLSSNQQTGYEGDYYTRTENSSEVTYVRFYCKIIVNTKQYYSFVISTSTSSSATYPVIRPQLELCLATNTEQLPTPWIPGPQDFSSEIKQTADSISSTVTGINGRLTTVEQNSDSITSQVTQLQKGKNLLKGTVSGSSWKSVTTPTGSIHNIEGLDSDGFITAKSGDPYLRHPDITIKKNTYYTLSLYSKTTSAFNFLINSPNSDFTEFSVTIPSGTSSSTRRSVSFKIDGTGNVSIRPIFQTTTIQYPQLELGTTATEFETSFAEIGSKITQAIDSIDLNVTGVTANQLATAGIHLSAGNGDPGTITLNAENFSLVDSNNDLVFGKESGSSNLTFSGDIKNGTSGSGFDGAYTNEIRADGTGNLGGRWIQWDPDPTYGGLYIGPGPSSGYEDYDVMSDIAPSGDDYNGDGIRVFPNGRIHFQGQMDGNFKFGKIGIEGNRGYISIYGEGSSNNRQYNINLSRYGLSIKPQTFSNENILEYGAMSAYTNTDSGAISFGSSADVGGYKYRDLNNQNDTRIANAEVCGYYSKYNQHIFLKGADGFAYAGYTGIINSDLIFINGILIGQYSDFSTSGRLRNVNDLFPSQ